jgi:hypothetical protein
MNDNVRKYETLLSRPEIDNVHPAKQFELNRRSLLFSFELCLINTVTCRLPKRASHISYRMRCRNEKMINSSSAETDVLCV